MAWLAAACSAAAFVPIRQDGKGLASGLGREKGEFRRMLEAGIGALHVSAGAALDFHRTLDLGGPLTDGAHGNGKELLEVDHDHAGRPDVPPAW